MPAPVLATVRDQEGRPVSLTSERWRHVLVGHPELGPFQRDVLDAVAHPAVRLPGRERDEQWFYAAGVGPSRWLKVVVTYAQGSGTIVTAFARRRTP